MTSKKKTIGLTTLLILIGFVGMGNRGCEPTDPTSSSGVKKASVTIQTDADGNSIEQKNIIGRLIEDNKPGSIKHLYVISPMSGQVILYSTVKGKVTSGGKRLTPTTVVYTPEPGTGSGAMNVSINGRTYSTPEVIQDDGTYGTSSEYIYWWDAQGRYHQHFRGMCEVHISDQPLNVGSVTINLSPVEQ